MKQVIIFIILMVMVAGCTSTNNPAAATSDTLQYTLSTAKPTYTVGDTLHFTLTVRNFGSTTDTVAIGDAILCTWSLKSASGAVMYSGRAPMGNLIGLLPVVPGESNVIDRWTHGLNDSTGSPLPAGSYTFSVNYASHPASVGLSVE